VIALDNGDTLHGTFHAVHSEGEAFIEPVNMLASMPGRCIGISPTVRIGCANSPRTDPSSSCE